jgi:hypothetical protein
MSFGFCHKAALTHARLACEQDSVPAAGLRSLQTLV